MEDQRVSGRWLLDWLAMLGLVQAGDDSLRFVKRNPTWFTNTIEPSLSGASEVRRVFLQAIDSL